MMMMIIMTVTLRMMIAMAILMVTMTIVMMINNVYDCIILDFDPLLKADWESQLKQLTFAQLLDEVEFQAKQTPCGWKLFPGLKINESIMLILF